MKYMPNIVQTINGRESLVDPLSIDYVDRIITISGEITNDVSLIFNASLRNLAKKSSEDIVVFINSPGGSVSDGLSMYDTINAVKLKGVNVVTCATGMAASMAAVLLTAGGTKGKRYCEPNAEVMIHQPAGAAKGQETDIQIAAKHILKTKARLNKILAEATGQTVETITADTERDNYMSAEEALEYGLVDRIGSPFAEI